MNLIDILLDSLTQQRPKYELLLQLYLEKMKQARRKIERKDQQQSEENQSEGSEDDFYYPYFLQVFASHFTVFLPHEEDRFSFIYSLLH